MSLKKLTVIFIVVTVAYCACNKKQAMFQLVPLMGDKMCPYHKVEFQAISRSVLDCAQLCSAHFHCITIIVQRDNNTCFGVNEYSPFSEYITMLGAKFYRPRMNESSPMIAPLPDSQFSASTDFSNGYAAHRARLCDTHCWSPFSDRQSSQDYLQVDFLEPRVLTSIITRGDPGYNNWVNSYIVLTSNDCTTFVAITDVSTGGEKIFVGNVDRSSDVENAIEPPVVTRCLRSHAVTWRKLISLRIEAMGYFA